jgi:hypothetical protein
MPYRDVPCDDCGGSGKARCMGCHGGYVSMPGLGGLTLRSPCPTCRATGYFTCLTCSGKGTRSQRYASTSDQGSGGSDAELGREIREYERAFEEGQEKAKRAAVEIRGILDDESLTKAEKTVRTLRLITERTSERLSIKKRELALLTRLKERLGGEEDWDSRIEGARQQLRELTLEYSKCQKALANLLEVE